MGRPNVGKSTLFNRLIGKREAIVDNISGVTRDRNYGEVEWAGKYFTLIDTGGYVPNSTDLLGIVSEGDVMITDNAANNSDIKIHASIFSQNGGFGAENYDTRPIAGKIELLGGIIQDTRRAVGTFSGVTTNHGFDKRYRYDERFLLVSPPHFPGTGSYEIISWFE